MPSSARLRNRTGPPSKCVSCVDAPPEAVDFAKFLVTSDVAEKAGASGATLPVKKGSEASVTDPNMKAVLDGLNAAPFVQLYLDQYFTSEIGGQVNDQAALLFAGATTPEDAAAAITATAGG